jgi:hypothetical protein
MYSQGFSPGFWEHDHINDFGNFSAVLLEKLHDLNFAVIK